MIDFRYHLVSIVAVFLALAIGIIIGATALRGSVFNALNTASQTELKDNNALRAQNRQLGQEVAVGNAFAQAGSGYLLDHLLQGEKVVLVTAPNADSGTVSGIITALRQSGARLTGQVSLTPQFVDSGQANESALSSAATSLAPAGVTLPTSPADSQIPGQQAADSVIAAAIMAKSGTTTLAPSQTSSVLNGLGQQGFLKVTGPSGGTSLSGQASLAVVVIPGGAPPATASSLSPENLALISLAHDLQQAGSGALLAGSIQSSGQGSAIIAITSGAASVSITTVDNADTETGQIFVVQALRKLLEPHAAPTAYGIGPGTAPSPAPSTSPSPSASASPSPPSTKPKK